MKAEAPNAQHKAANQNTVSELRQINGTGKLVITKSFQLGRYYFEDENL